MYGVKTLKLDIPLVPETRINWAFVPLHIAIIYILKLCLDAERQKLLSQAGYDYSAVQSIVNKKLSPSRKSVDEIAREVIHGDWGNGSDRKKRITSAGYDYSAVQKRVNELLK